MIPIRGMSAIPHVCRLVPHGLCNVLIGLYVFRRVSLCTSRTASHFALLWQRDKRPALAVAAQQRFGIGGDGAAGTW